MVVNLNLIELLSVLGGIQQQFFGRLKQEAKERASKIIKENKIVRDWQREAYKQVRVLLIELTERGTNSSTIRVRNFTIALGITRAYKLNTKDAYRLGGKVRYRLLSPLLRYLLDGFIGKTLLDTGTKVNLISAK